MMTLEQGDNRLREVVAAFDRVVNVGYAMSRQQKFETCGEREREREGAEAAAMNQAKRPVRGYSITVFTRTRDYCIHIYNCDPSLRLYSVLCCLYEYRVR